MKLNPASRARLLIDVTLDVDPTGSTVEVQVDGGSWSAATWQGSPVQRNVFANGATVTRWTQTARTTGYFAGSDATAAGATVLAAGRHLTKTRVVVGGDTLVNNSTPIDVEP